MNRRVFLSTLALGPAGAQQVGDLLRSEPTDLEGRAHRAVMGRNGVVATADLHGSLAGLRMLMKGGNAVDAIVAAAAALNVVEPYMSGVAGFGGYMLIYMARDGKVVALDLMGSSPAAARIDRFTEQDCDEGYLSPIVPGSLGGWAAALDRYGTMSLGDVFEPAIDLTEQGFVVTRFDAMTFAATASKLAKFPTTARIFLPDGKPPREGQVLNQKELARTLRHIAVAGADTLYQGELAEKIVKFLGEHGGILTLNDMRKFQVRWREPIQIEFCGHRLYGMPPGSCGMTMFQALNIMNGFDLKNMDPFGADFAHRWLEAQKLALLDDNRHNTGKDVEIPVARLISNSYAAEQRAKIDPRRVAGFPVPRLGTDGTTSLAAADRWGNIVCFTQSLVSGQRAKGVMSPTLVFRGDRPRMAVGAAGGYTIPQTVGQVIAKALVYGMDIQQAIASPRLLINRAQGQVPVGNEAETYLDPSFPQKTRAALEALGHRLARPGNAGGVQGVAIDQESGALSGGADPRRDGHALAF